MNKEDVGKLREAILKVIANLSEHDLRNIACIDDCYYCPKCIKDVCPTKNMDWVEDCELSCEHAWIEAAKDENIQRERIRQILLYDEEIINTEERMSDIQGGVYNMRDVLIVVDMQNDFIDGSLGTKEAQAIVPNVAAKIKAYRAAGKPIIFTRDTHEANYLETHEGKNLPVPHCIAGTAGYEISPELHVHDKDMVVNKGAFGYLHWEKLGDVNSIELCGLCTDICVVSNALILRSLYPEFDITVDANCCAGVTPESHQAALTVMRSCQVEVIGE